MSLRIQKYLVFSIIFYLSLQNLQHRTYNTLLNDIVNYIKSFHNQETSDSLETIIPSATLLTGVNQPDHFSQFAALIDKIRLDSSVHPSYLIKCVIANTIDRFYSCYLNYLVLNSKQIVQVFLESFQQLAHVPKTTHTKPGDFQSQADCLKKKDPGLQ